MESRLADIRAPGHSLQAVRYQGLIPPGQSHATLAAAHHNCTAGAQASRMGNRERTRWRTWLLAAALPVCGIMILAVGSLDGRVLASSIALVPGTTWAPSFRVTRGVRYIVLLEVDRNIPSLELECLMGQVPYQPPCPIDPVVGIQWTLRRGSQEVAAGDSRYAVPEHRPDRVTLLIGQFKADFGARYVLELVPLLDGSALAAGNPRVVVQFHPEVTKGFHIFAPLIAFATGIAAIPLALLALGALAGWRQP